MCYDGSPRNARFERAKSDCEDCVLYGGYYPYPSTPLEAWGMDISHLVPSKQKRPDIGLQGFAAFFKSADFGIVCWL